MRAWSKPFCRVCLAQGPILAFIYAVKELLETSGSGGLGCNVAFVFEGEEENGSAGFREAVSQNLRWFEGTRLAVISNTLWVGERTPCLTYGMRGMIAFSIDVKGEGASERAREQRMP